MTALGDSTTARSIVFSSSRTLPGQSDACSVSSTPGATPSMRLPARCACLRDEVLDQRRDVLAPLAQRRNVDRDHVEPVEEILLEPAVGDHLPEVAVGRGDDPHVDLLGALGAERLELALLQHAQQLRLQRRAHRADLVEEDACRRRPARTCPSCSSVAPVNAPRTWPNSSDSSSVSGIAAQFTLISGISRCALW